MSLALRDQIIADLLATPGYLALSTGGVTTDRPTYTGTPELFEVRDEYDRLKPLTVVMLGTDSPAAGSQVGEFITLLFAFYTRENELDRAIEMRAAARRVFHNRIIAGYHLVWIGGRIEPLRDVAYTPNEWYSPGRIRATGEWS